MWHYKFLPSVTLVYVDEYKELELLMSVKSICDSFNIKLIEAELDTIETSFDRQQDTDLVHLIYRTASPFQLDIVLKIVEVNKSLDSASLIFTYENLSHSLKYRNEIESFKKHMGNDSINIMRPDIKFEQGFSCSPVKILDNVICDTLRVKFIPKKLGDSFPYMPEANDLIKEASRLVAQYKMWHRASTDGYIAVRVNGGFLITGTRTDTANIDVKKEVSFVQDLNQETKELQYIGNRLPSSDSVEATILFKENPDLHSILHTHDSERFTRNDLVLNDLNIPKVELLPYGEIELGKVVSSTYRTTKSNLIVMLEHGEVFFGTKSKSCVEVAKTWLTNSNDNEVEANK